HVAGLLRGQAQQRGARAVQRFLLDLVAGQREVGIVAAGTELDGLLQLGLGLRVLLLRAGSSASVRCGCASSGASCTALRAALSASAGCSARTSHCASCAQRKDEFGSRCSASSIGASASLKRPLCAASCATV